jgi:hypothetical protein
MAYVRNALQPESPLTMSLTSLWSEPQLELNLTFDTLREYQWGRFIKHLWAQERLIGPFPSRFDPAQPPQAISPIVPEPTATLSQYALMRVTLNLQVGVEILLTRSLFECVSILIPLNMFPDPHAESHEVQAARQSLYELALALYEVGAFSIGTLGVGVGLFLLAELMADDSLRSQFIKHGSFFARDDILAVLRLSPEAYPEVKPALRWCTPAQS